MSNISQAHNLVAYISGKTKALSNQRLASFSWKTAQNGIKRDSVAVSLPVINSDSIIDNIDLLIPHIRTMLESTQDNIIRAMLNNPEFAGMDLVSDEDINIAAVIDYLDNSNESGRLTKETVGNWFDSNVADSLMLALAAKLGVSDIVTDAQSKQIETIVGEFKGKVSGLAGGKTVYPVKLCESLKKVLALAPENDVIAGKFNNRLDKMIANSVTEINLFDAL